MNTNEYKMANNEYNEYQMSPSNRYVVIIFIFNVYIYVQ
jgi:hypothetical protein